MSFSAARKKAGLTQEDVGREFNISSAAVCQWENGKTVPDARKRPQIAKLYGCTVDELLAEDSKEE